MISVWFLELNVSTETIKQSDHTTFLFNQYHKESWSEFPAFTIDVNAGCKCLPWVALLRPNFILIKSRILKKQSKVLIKSRILKKQSKV